jgi:hypothetical protein
VRVGDHQVRTGDPARSLDAQPARRPEHPHHAVAGGLHVGVLRDLRVGRGDIGAGTLDRDPRIDPVEGVDQRAGRREGVVERLQDRRALDGHAEVLGARSVQRHRPEEPGEPKGESDQEQSATRGLGDREASPAAAGSEQAASHGQRDPLQRDRDDPADQ